MLGNLPCGRTRSDAGREQLWHVARLRWLQTKPGLPACQHFLQPPYPVPLTPCVCLQEEGKLLSLQRQQPPGEWRFSAGHFALLQLVRFLERLFLQLCVRQRFLSHTAEAGRLGLCQAPLPGKAIKVRPL